MRNSRQVKEEIHDTEGFTKINPLPISRVKAGSIYYRGAVPGVTQNRNKNQIRRKVPLPTHTGFNYAGLIIGPKGANQKRLEEETGCKVLIRGRGAQKEGQTPQLGDFDEPHVLVAGNSEEQVSNAVQQIEKIIFADEKTRNIIR
jgi:hypothetical protein